jgi:hypothetical protein
VDEMLRYLRAMVVLQAAMLDEKEDRPKPEILLHRAGMGIQEIAGLLEKTYGAVAQTISRERRDVRRQRSKPKLLTDGRKHDS